MSRAGDSQQLPAPGDQPTLAPMDESDDDGTTPPTFEPAQLSPLSIQAAALVRSIEGLSNIFWISIAGTFLTIFFAGLSQLEVNASTDYIYLGEYQVPRSILPLASLTFALITFWMTSNRLKMLAFVLSTTRLPRDMVHEIFHLNPPILHIFEQSNADPWRPFSGVGVLIINWAVFFGNSIALTLATAAQQGASSAVFDLPTLSAYAVLIIVAMVYGIRSIFPPLRNILGILHGVDFRVGWPRQIGALLVLMGVYAANNADLIGELDQPDDLLGPAVANAVDGDTLFMLGVEVELFGIDAVEQDQICQNADGADYPCGRVATQALQQLVAHNPVICNPLFSLSDTRRVAICELISENSPAPTQPEDFLSGERPNNLSRLLVAQGHALGVGIGRQVLDQIQLEAQRTRTGIWQGSFEPPAAWRNKH
jgi:endonuclease YncB( thermonuclease family)